MVKQKLGFIAVTLLLACAHALAGDPATGAKDAHAAPAKESPKEAAPAKDAHAAAPKDAHAAEPKEAAKGAVKDSKEASKEVPPAKDSHAGSSKGAHAAEPKAAAKDAHGAVAKDEHAADAHEPVASKEEPKPVARKVKRKKPKSEVKADAKAHAKGHGDDKAGADHHVDAAPAVPASIAPATRVRPRDRAAAASAVAAEQSAAAHDDGHGDSKHGDAHAAAPASTKQDTHGAAADAHQADTHAAPAAAHSAAPSAAHAQEAHSAKAGDAHHADAAPSVPANIEPTQRQRVKSPVAATAAPSVPATHTSGHDDHSTADAHGNSAHAAHDAKQAAKDSGGHDAHHDAKHDAKSHDATAATAHAGDECNLPLKAEIAALFDRWNASLRTGDPKKVVANYAPDSVLLPTVSNRARFTIAEKEDYFMHFLQRRPQGYIDDRLIDVDCNSATDAGLYTFRFSDGSSVKARYSFSYKKINGQWLITSHHSSGMPEKPEAQPAAHAEAHAAPKATDPGSATKGWVRFP